MVTSRTGRSSDSQGAGPGLLADSCPTILATRDTWPQGYEDLLSPGSGVMEPPDAEASASIWLIASLVGNGVLLVVVSIVMFMWMRLARR